MTTGSHWQRCAHERRLRVVHIVNNLNYGGLERVIHDLVRRGDPDRQELHVLALQYLGVFSEGLDAYAQLHTAPPLPKWTLLWPAPLIRQLRAIAPDVVHTHSGVWYKASLAARQAGVRAIVHTEHGRRRPDPWDMRLVDGIASRRTDVVVAVSEPLAAQLARTVVRRGTRIEVIANGVDTDRYQPRSAERTVRQELGIASEVPIIGSIGRLEHIKGYDVMVEAFAVLRRMWPADDAASGPPPVLLLCGEGAERAALERQAARSGVADAIHFLGWRNDIEALHATFDIFTLASRSEGTSIGLLEAMSAGLCPVVTDVGGNPGVLGAELRHRLVPANAPDALARAWRDALQHGEARQHDAAAARARVVPVFGVEQMVRAYDALYREVACADARGGTSGVVECASVTPQ
ncbi:MAG TPA: glycosyltransferase [Gemmatimonadaceae bacterium]|nr:glycosyltransferase [Gemmatimonadaceae bacterium]